MRDRGRVRAAARVAADHAARPRRRLPARHDRGEAQSLDAADLRQPRVHLHDRRRRFDAGRSYEELLAAGTIQVEPLTYIRGRTLPNQFLIVDEAQNLTPHEVKTIITRCGDGTKIVLTGDPDQIDNPYVDAASNGLTTVAERFKTEAHRRPRHALQGRAQRARRARHVSSFKSCPAPRHEPVRSRAARPSARGATRCAVRHRAGASRRRHGSAAGRAATVRAAHEARCASPRACLPALTARERRGRAPAADRVPRARRDAGAALRDRSRGACRASAFRCSTSCGSEARGRARRRALPGQARRARARAAAARRARQAAAWCGRSRRAATAPARRSRPRPVASCRSSRCARVILDRLPPRSEPRRAACDRRRRQPGARSCTQLAAAVGLAVEVRVEPRLSPARRPASARCSSPTRRFGRARGAPAGGARGVRPPGRRRPTRRAQPLRLFSGAPRGRSPIRRASRSTWRSALGLHRRAAPAHAGRARARHRSDARRRELRRDRAQAVGARAFLGARGDRASPSAPTAAAAWRATPATCWVICACTPRSRAAGHARRAALGRVAYRRAARAARARARRATCARALYRPNFSAQLLRRTSVRTTPQSPPSDAASLTGSS